MQLEGFIQRNFAGHSLGEYSTLASVAGVLPVSSLVGVVFYRGITVQRAVERDFCKLLQLCSLRTHLGFHPPSMTPPSARSLTISHARPTAYWRLSTSTSRFASQQFVCAGERLIEIGPSPTLPGWPPELLRPNTRLETTQLAALGHFMPHKNTKVVYYQFDDEVATESAPEATAVSTLALVVAASTPACVAAATSTEDAPIKSLEVLDLNGRCRPGAKGTR